MPMPILATAKLRPTIADFQAGTLYSVREVAALFGYVPATIRIMIRNNEIKAVKMPFSGIRIRRPKQSRGRPNYKIDGVEVRRLWGRMELESAAEWEETPTYRSDAASSANRINDAFDKLTTLTLRERQS